MLIDYNLIGVHIRAARKRKSYTQEQLAELLSISADMPREVSTILQNSTPKEAKIDNRTS